MRAYYKYYFEQLAIQNKIIAHVPVTAPSFFFIQDKYSPDAFDSAIKSAIHAPAFLLEDFFYDAKENSSRGYCQDLNGRFNILTNTTTGDQSTIDAAKTQCQAIAEDFIMKMREELAEGGTITVPGLGTSPKVFFKVKYKLDFIGPIAINYYGVTVGFSWDTFLPGQSITANWS